MTNEVSPNEVLSPSLISNFIHKLSHIRNELSIRRTIVLLQSMDDSNLSDIGIGRGEIEDTVRHGRGR